MNLKEIKKAIVIDEFAGLWVACIPASSFLMVKEVLIFSLIAFILFRIFDIWKPYPINKLDEKFKNGFGIVADDVIAGICRSNYKFNFLFICLIIFVFAKTGLSFCSDGEPTDGNLSGALF